MGTQTVDFIDEKHVVLAERRKYARKIARLVEHRPGGYFEIHPKLVGYDAGKGSLAETGRAVEKQMVESLVAKPCGRHKHFQILDNLVLTAERVELRRAKRLLYLALTLRSRPRGTAYVKIVVHSGFPFFLQIYSKPTRK